MAFIAREIVILNKQEAVPTLKNEEPVPLKVSAPPRLSVNVAITQHPDYVHATSSYVARMFGSDK